MRRSIFFALLIITFVIHAESSPAKRPPKPCPEPTPEGQEPAYKEIEVTNPGTLSGKVTFKGEHKPMKWKVVADKEFCGEEIIDESLVAGQDGGLQYVVVTIKDIKEGKPLPREVKEMANKDCRYQPHVEAMSVCSKMMVTNHDPILHNTHAYIGEGKFEGGTPEVTHDGLLVANYDPANTGTNTGPLVSYTTLFNLGLPNQDFKPKKTMRETGLITLKCDAGHTWMTGYVWVTPHPYVAVTDSKGRFVIKDIPAGDYTLNFWHETLGEREKKVSVKEGEDVAVDVVFTER